jgi:DNA-binding winged helix-turn-helix (wHTH) protein/Tfp pilus assembly protein PilF/TolB-like protein
MQSTVGSSVPDIAPSANQPSIASGGPILYEFDSFRLDPANRLLTQFGKEVPLPGRAFDALLLLVARPGGLVTKDELMARVWGGSFVEESNLTVAISTLRRALSEDPHDRRYIQTVARQGYRFIAEVRELQEPPRRARAVVPQEPHVTSAVEEPATEQAAAPVELVTEAAEAATAVPSPPQDVPGQYGKARSPRVQTWVFGAVAAGLVLALVVGGRLLLRPREPLRSLAVLPYAIDKSSSNSAAGGSALNDFVLLGMTDGMISRLGGELVVRPTSSVLRYSNAAPVGPVAAGREQGVDAVLTGALEETSGQTILRLRLIRVGDGLTLWQDSFRAASNDLPQLQQSAGDAVARELHSLGATAAEKPSPASATLTRASDPAYQLYLRGRYFWNRRTVDGLRKSADYFRQAIDADPNYAPAYAGLADSYALLASFSVEPGSSANADARSAAFSAIHLDPTLAEPHASLGMIYFFTDWNLSAAEQEFEQAIRLNPNYATAHHWYALDLAAMGRFPQALYEIHLAQKLDPLSLIIGTNVGWIEYLARDYTAALSDLHRVLELDPHFARARTRLGMVEMATNDNAAAVADLTQAVALSGDEDPWVEGLLGDAEARAGNKPAAQRILSQIQKRSASQYVPPTSRALVLLGLDRRSEAVAALAQAVGDHSTSMVYARVDPSLDPLRSDPSFQALLARIKP